MCGQQLRRDPSNNGSSKFLVLKRFSGEGTLWTHPGQSLSHVGIRLYFFGCSCTFYTPSSPLLNSQAITQITVNVCQSGAATRGPSSSHLLGRSCLAPSRWNSLRRNAAWFPSSFHNVKGWAHASVVSPPRSPSMALLLFVVL